MAEREVRQSVAWLAESTHRRMHANSLVRAPEGDLNRAVNPRDGEREAGAVGSVASLGLGIAETLRISVGTLWDARRGVVTREASQARLMTWAARCLEHARARVEVAGREHAETPERFVVMSNHQSLYDIPVLYVALERPIRMVAKAELFRVPVWGKALAASEFVRLDRSDRRQAMASLDDAAKSLASGLDIWMAPEGTRSPDGSLGEFKRGGFHVALAAKTRILPITIDGTRRILPARAVRVRHGVAVVATIHPPIDPAAFGRRRLKELVQEVRRVIAEPLGQSGVR